MTREKRITLKAKALLACILGSAIVGLAGCGNQSLQNVNLEHDIDNHKITANKSAFTNMGIVDGSNELREHPKKPYMEALGSDNSDQNSDLSNNFKLENNSIVHPSDHSASDDNSDPYSKIDFNFHNSKLTISDAGSRNYHQNNSSDSDNSSDGSNVNDFISFQLHSKSGNKYVFYPIKEFDKNYKKSPFKISSHEAAEHSLVLYTHGRTNYNANN